MGLQPHKVSLRSLAKAIVLLRNAPSLLAAFELTRRSVIHALGLPTPKRPLAIKLHGLRWEFGDASELSTIAEIWDWCSYEKLPSFVVRPGWVVVDAGANVGVYTCKAALQCGPSGHVYAFEPNPIVAQRLRANLLRNGFNNATPIQAALGASKGKAWLSAPDNESLIGRVSAHSPLVDGSYPIAVLSLADFVEDQGIDTIHCLKLDTEGSELEALKGALRTMHRIHRIVMEFHSGELREQCQQLFAENGLALRFQYQKRCTSSGKR